MAVLDTKFVSAPELRIGGEDIYNSFSAESSGIKLTIPAEDGTPISLYITNTGEGATYPTVSSTTALAIRAQDELTLHSHYSTAIVSFGLTETGATLQRNNANTTLLVKGDVKVLPGPFSPTGFNYSLIAIGARTGTDYDLTSAFGANLTIVANKLSDQVTTNRNNITSLSNRVTALENSSGGASDLDNIVTPFGPGQGAHYTVLQYKALSAYGTSPFDPAFGSNGFLTLMLQLNNLPDPVLVDKFLLYNTSWALYGQAHNEYLSLDRKIENIGTPAPALSLEKQENMYWTLFARENTAPYAQWMLSLTSENTLPYITAKTDNTVAHYYSAVIREEGTVPALTFQTRTVKGTGDLVSVHLFCRDEEAAEIYTGYYSIFGINANCLHWEPMDGKAGNTLDILYDNACEFEQQVVTVGLLQRKYGLRCLNFSQFASFENTATISQILTFITQLQSRVAVLEGSN